jgi:hypothetical protein
MSSSYTASPPWRQHGASGTALHMFMHIAVLEAADEDAGRSILQRFVSGPADGPGQTA